MASWKRQGFGRQGFTLLELLVVLLLLTLLLGLAVPGLRGGWDSFRVAAGLRGLAATLRTARSQAVTQGQRVRCLVNLREGSYRVEGGRGGLWPRRLRLLEADLVWTQPDVSGYIAFYGDGSSSGGYLALEEPSGRRHILEVEVITGRVSLRSLGG